MAEQNTAPPPPPGFDTVVSSGAPPPPPPGFDTVVSGGAPPPPTTQQPPSLWQQLKNEEAPTIGNIKGMVKGAEKTGAGLIDLTGAYLSGNTPFSPPVKIDPNGRTAQAFDKAATWLRKNTDTSKDPYQKEGDIAESVLEFMAMPEAEEAKLAEAIPGIADRFTSAGKLIKTLQGDSKLARVFRVGLDSMKAGARAGTEQGVQTLVKTGGDTEQAGEAATTGALIGAGIGGGGAAWREGREALQELRPGTRTIAGAKFDTMANGELNLRPFQPGTTDAATAAVDEASGNIGKTAVANSLNRSNAARPKGITAETNPARMLPAPEGSAQGFRVDTTPPRETGMPPRTATVTEQTGTQTVPNPDYEAPAGELIRQPGQTAEQTAEEIGPGATTATPERSYAGPGDVDTRNATQKRIDAARGLVPERMLVPPETVEAPVYQQRPVVTEPLRKVTTLPDRATEMQPDPQRIGGGGPLILTDDGQATSVERARAHVAEYERNLSDPDIGPRRRAAMQTAHDDLTEQLRRYDDYAASQSHFPAHDTVAAVQHTESLGDAGQQLKDAHAPFWKKAGPEFKDLRNQEKALENALRSEGRTSERSGLRQQLAANRQKQMDFFDQNRTQLSPEEWQTHRNGYQDGIVLSNLNELIADHFNGVTRQEAAASKARGGTLQRRFEPSKGFNQELQDFYSDGANRKVLERTIGKDHMLDLKELGQLFEDSDRQKATKGLMDAVSSSIRRHHYGIGGLAGGGLAYGLAHVLGAGTGIALGGAAAAGTVTGTLQYITDRLATDPKFAKSFIYATTNKIPPRIAGPLLASRIIQSEQTQELKQPQEKK